jgi:ribonuclease HII
MGALGFKYELRYSGVIAGVDEAGRGPWAGPVVAAAVILDKKRFPVDIHDSKKLNKIRRAELCRLILMNAQVGVGTCSVEEIDRYNILGATKHAMRRAYDALPVKPDMVLVDGNQLPDIPSAMDAVVGGDALCASIAAASIVAKVTRDTIMMELAKEFPQYGFEQNAGYGTKLHQEALALFGITAHHRRSFAPIRKLLESAPAKVA